MLIGLFGWVGDVLSKLTFNIDIAIYGLAKIVYDVFMFIADARILNDSTAANLTRRIYAILGIFMLFVLAYNLLMYIIDPDRMTDKEQGLGSIIKDVLIALAVMLILPTLFNRLYSLQSTVLKSGVIENLVLGGYTTIENYDANGDNSAKNGIEKGVNILIANTYAAFLLPDNGDTTVMDCLETNENKNVPEDYCEAYQKVRKNGYIDEYEDFVTNDDYRYWPLVTTVVGVVLIFFMLSFCVNLAIRAGKLAILQLIAPIPLLLELIPKFKGTRREWVETLFKVYLEVFIYLAMIYLVIFLISLVPDVITGLIHTTFQNQTGGGITHLIAILILSYGLLQFGKTAPEFVYKILKIESKGTLKAAATRALHIGGGIGAAGGAAAIMGAKNFKTLGKDLRTDWRAERLPLKSFGKAAFNLAAGTAIGATRAAYSNRAGGIKPSTMFGASKEAAVKSQKTVDSLRKRPQLFNEFMTGDYSLLDPEGRAQMRSVFTGETPVDRELEALKGATGSVTDKGKENSFYKDLDKAFNKEKMNALNAPGGKNWDIEFANWKQQAGNANKNEADFASEVKASRRGDRYESLRSAAIKYEEREAQRRVVNDSKLKDYKTIAVKYLTNLERSPDINLSDSKNANINKARKDLRDKFVGGDLDRAELAPGVTGSDLLKSIMAIDKSVKERAEIEEIGLIRRKDNKSGNDKDKK